MLLQALQIQQCGMPGAKDPWMSGNVAGTRNGSQTGSKTIGSQLGSKEVTHGRNGRCAEYDPGCKSLQHLQFLHLQWPLCHLWLLLPQLL